MKDELRNIISGTSKVRNGEVIQTASRYLSRSKETSNMAKDQKHYKEKEEKVLRDFVTKNNLWLHNINSKDYVSEGAKQKVYLKDSKHVIKLNDGIYYQSWKDYFNSILLHNYFFPDTAYELIGFIEETKYQKIVLYAVVKQEFVRATESTNLVSV